MDLTERFRRAVRHALGLRDGDAGELWRQGLYRARVDVCASDGSTVDVTFEDERLPPQKGVPVRVGVPGVAAVVPAGAVVLVGWERGDPALVYAVPSWEATTPSKLVLAASLIEAAGSNYAAVLDTVLPALRDWVVAVNTVLASNCVNGSPLTAQPAQSTALTSFATELAAPGAYKSTKLKHG